jgi:hypothetical protein
MRIYLAHPVSDYGSVRQAQAIKALEEVSADLGRPLTLVNPDSPIHQAGYAAEGMRYFKGIVESCDGLAFMRFPDGSIGAGVGREIRWALVGNLRIYEVFKGAVYTGIESMPTPIITIEETREMLARLSERPSE